MTASCAACPFWSGPGLTCVQQAQTGLTRFRRHPAGTFLYRAGEPSQGIHVLTRGVVAIQRNTVQGEAMILRLLFPVSPFGIEAWALGRRHDSHAVALVESSVCRMDSERVRQFLEQHPKGGMALMEQLAADLAASEESALMLGKSPVQERLEKLLLRLLEHAPDRAASRAWPGAQRFRLPCSRQQLATVLCARPETLSRAIGQAERAGWLRLTGRWAEVLPARARQRRLDGQATAHEVERR